MNRLLVLLALGLNWANVAMSMDEHKAAQSALQRCHGCGNQAQPKKCARCAAVSYCSKECQVKDWPMHKHSCAYLKRLKDEVAHGTWLVKANPKFHDAKQPGGFSYKHNCDFAAALYDLMLECGAVPEIFEDGALPAPAMLEANMRHVFLEQQALYTMSLAKLIAPVELHTYWTNKKGHLTEIDDVLHALGDGARLMIKGYNKSTPRDFHVWLAIFVDGQVHHLDPQSGRKLDVASQVVEPAFDEFVYQQTYPAVK